MNTLAHRPAAFRQSQQGAALIFALSFLLVMTMLGLSTVTSNTMQERMAANFTDLQRAFEAAEAGLRVAERAVADNAIVPIAPVNTPADPAFWEARLQENDAVVYADTPLAGVAAQPTYLVERVDFLGEWDSGEVSDGAFEAPIQTRNLFRLTSRAVGAQPGTVVILQSTVLR